MSGLLRRRPGVDPRPPKGHFGGHFGVRNRRHSEVRFRSRLFVDLGFCKKIILGILHLVPTKRLFLEVAGPRQIQSRGRLEAGAAAVGG